MGNVHVDDVHNMNALDVAQYKYAVLVAPNDAVTAFQAVSNRS